MIRCESPDGAKANLAHTLPFLTLSHVCSSERTTHETSARFGLANTSKILSDRMKALRLSFLGGVFRLSHLPLPKTFSIRASGNATSSSSYLYFTQELPFLTAETRIPYRTVPRRERLDEPNCLQLHMAAPNAQHHAHRRRLLVHGARRTETLQLSALTAGDLEFFGGFLILMGLFTQPVAFVLAGEMAVAYSLAHAPHGFWPMVNKGELAVLYCFVFLYLATAGAGPWSLDRLRRRRGVGSC